MITNGSELALIITAAGTLVTALGGIVVQVYTVSRQNRKISEGVAISLSNADKLDQHTEKLEAVQIATDGLTERLGDAKLAEGIAEGDAAGHARGIAEGSAVGHALGLAEGRSE